ncbi:peptide chain release factor 1 [Candidatus Borkfalkia ceftriaxoniphila]|uniref:Peptide chain release factor 1 n=1 Tax=Candidatus Borkfalkia ceftriaxoniphila TaxID=2508949 RepID=A0A4Q2KF58_9FIRM|nr:peptide chain release factor 1 [Candidatus Borkfalkia ceftriaxoniphila]RXZ62082.1 peptide chain release factor 1 [Candidatus Borkfalkia ceftriaxoniphila]
MIKKLEDILAKYRALSEQMADPAVIADPEKWTKCAKEHSDCSESAEKYLEYKKVEKEMEDAFAAAETETDAEMKDMLVQEGYACKEKLAAINAELRILLLPKDKNDERNVVMEIRGGAGGEEANLFAAELFRMYQHYAESMRWKLDIIDMSDTELGGMKEVVFSVSGKGVYSKLKYESGVHRVQRVPETESQGRVHTSTVTVAVLPEAEDVDVEINEKDLKIDTYRSGGAGGQHVNKTESCIRLTHLPTGIVVTCQDERSQIKNREKAMKVLKSRLYDYYNTKYQSEYSQNRKNQVGTGDRSERIRTYNFPQNRVTDHRIGLTLYSLDNFMLGDISQMIESLAIADREAQLSSEEEA